MRTYKELVYENLLRTCVWEPIKNLCMRTYKELVYDQNVYRACVYVIFLAVYLSWYITCIYVS